MPRVLLTAFEPYGEYDENASWLTLVELTRNLPREPQVITRRYPVDFAVVQERLARDLADEYDFALHLGQAPGSSCVRLEAIGVNIGGPAESPPEAYTPLTEEGPVAYRSSLPLAEWSARITAAGIPAQVSYHAGTYPCNATLYWTHHLAARGGLRTRAAFIHLPLDTSQVARTRRPAASLPASLSAQAVHLMLEAIAELA